MSGPTKPDLSPGLLLLGVLAFCSELALAVGAWMVGLRVVDGWVGWVLALLCAATVVGIWARYMSPKAPKRMSDSGRAKLGCTLFLVVGLALAMTNSMFGVILALGGCLVTAVTQTRAAAVLQQWTHR